MDTERMFYRQLYILIHFPRKKGYKKTEKKW